MEGWTLGIEHGWLCIRTEKGWLLWSMKVENIGTFNLEQILETAAAKAKENPDL
jgi:hypothetical protein